MQTTTPKITNMTPITGASVYFLGRAGDVTAHLLDFFVKPDQAPMTIQFFEAPTVTAPRHGSRPSHGRETSSNAWTPPITAQRTPQQ